MFDCVTPLDLAGDANENQGQIKVKSWLRMRIVEEDLVDWDPASLENRRNFYARDHFDYPWVGFRLARDH